MAAGFRSRFVAFRAAQPFHMPAGIVARSDAIVQRAAARSGLGPKAMKLGASAAAFAAAMTLAEPARCMEQETAEELPGAATAAETETKTDEDGEEGARGVTPSDSRVLAAASKGKPATPEDEIDFAAFIPDFGVEVGLGVVAGFSSGYAVKKLGRLAALTFGIGFIGLQMARHYGVLEDKHLPDLSTIDRSIKAHLDTDGDGKVTSKDINAIANRALRMLKANVPAASGFGVAFLIGLQYG